MTEILLSVKKPGHSQETASRILSSKETGIVTNRQRLISPSHFIGRRHLETDHELTLIIPAYNEERRLPRTLIAIKEFLDDWEIGRAHV